MTGREITTPPWREHETTVREAPVGPARSPRRSAGKAPVRPAGNAVGQPVGQALDRSPPAPSAPRAAPTADGRGGGRRGLAHLPALDGVRGAAVIAMLTYHAGVSWAPGALLSMDVFFALSGFLITSLLVSEWRRTGQINLRQFWARRARRLLPGLFLVMIGIGAYIAFISPPGERASLRGDALATLGYGANWHFVLAGKGYFDSFASPSPLLHMWSLAVEEQFYLVWPLVSIAILRRSRRRDTRALAKAAAVGAGISALIMAVLSLAGADSSRMYYGTDTRAQALLVGAALAAARPVGGFTHRAATRRAVSVLGAAGAAFILWTWLTADGQSAQLYRGGFLLVAIAVAAVLAAIVESPEGRLARCLSLRPLCYAGVISYGLYLWHWPVFLFLTHARTGLSGPWLFGARMALTTGIAALSYRYVEHPIRTQTFRIPRPSLTLPLTMTSLAVVVLVATTGSATSTGLAALTGKDGSGTPPPTAADPRHVHVLLVGDSLAFTLGFSLTDGARYGVDVVNRGRLGCGIARGGPVRTKAEVVAPNPACELVPQERAQEITQFDPDVVAVLLGRWEVIDRFHDGQWMHIGMPAYDSYLSTELDRLIGALDARGAKVVLLTTPCVQPQERPDGGRWAEDDPARITRFNQLLASALDRHPGQVSLLDLDSMLCPAGQLTSTVDGVAVRGEDGIHIGTEAGAFFLPRLAPTFVAEGSPHRELRLSSTR